MTVKKEEVVKEYLTGEDFLNEVIEQIEVQTKDGRYIIFKRLTKGEEAGVRKKTMKMVRGGKTNALEPQIDSEEYQIKMLALALVKPKMSEQDIRDKLSAQRADELFFLYTQNVGFGSLPQNL